MPPVDEFGIEYDDDVASTLQDPKSTKFMKVLDYRDKRNAKIKEKADAEAEAKLKKEKPSVFPFNFP